MSFLFKTLHCKKNKNKKEKVDLVCPRAPCESGLPLHLNDAAYNILNHSMQKKIYAAQALINNYSLLVI